MQSNRSSLIHATLGLTACLAFTSRALAQCPGPITGPDVIVGSVNGIQNYATSGTLDAVALGTTSCNIGNQNLNWIQNTVNHPLIGGAVYKYKVVDGSGRIEQLGLGWVKHAFAAFQENECCACPNPGGLLQLLQPGCSDPYTPQRNGSQSGLGPRYQVNPNTGAYFASHPVPSGGNNGRVQMNTSDLEPSSASVLYYGEVQYLALDDSRFNNNDNNTSYRQLTATGGPTSFTFSTTSTTQRQKCAVDAWDVAEPAVTLMNVIVPEDSTGVYDGNARLVLGFRTTDLGGGQWHYEYALYNQNSDRAVRGFSIPIPAGATISNIGFHDVAYLGGDGEANVNRDGTDWTPTLNAGSLTWTTQTFAANNNANALRFGTTYNFRFDANVPPTSGDLTLSQYKVANDVVVVGVDVPSDVPFSSFCAGDGIDTGHTTPCPCANNGGAGRGCANSVEPLGGLLTASGTPNPDTMVLAGAGMPLSVSCIYLQGDAVEDSTFGDGVRCAGGSLIRLRTRQNVGGTSTFPDSTDTVSLSVRGGVVPGSGVTRYYQTYYRNSAAAFCPPETFNVTNGMLVHW